VPSPKLFTKPGTRISPVLISARGLSKAEWRKIKTSNSSTLILPSPLSSQPICSTILSLIKAVSTVCFAKMITSEKYSFVFDSAIEDSRMAAN
jgi:hypothetical protein